MLLVAKQREKSTYKTLYDLALMSRSPLDQNYPLVHAPLSEVKNTPLLSQRKLKKAKHPGEAFENLITGKQKRK